MTIRTARKQHRCEHAKWRDRVGESPICTGRIEPGEKYAECYEHGDPYHPARYHVACYETESAMSAKMLPA